MTKTKTYLILFAFFYLHAAQAQPGGSNPPPPNGIPNGAPIDGAIIALLAAGGAMGYKKLKERNDTTE